jgi:DinB superfamily
MAKHIITFFFVLFSFISKTVAQETLNNTLSDKERKELIEALQNSFNKLNNAIDNLSLEQINYREKEKKWTIVECIEHITLAEIKFPSIVATEMQKPSNPEYRKKIKIKDEKIRPKMLSRIWKAKSPEIFKPTGKFTTFNEAITTFRDQRLKTIEYIKTTKDDLRNHFWKHPLTGTIDLYQTLLLMSAHLERHIEQIEYLKKSKEFPLK